MSKSVLKVVCFGIICVFKLRKSTRSKYHALLFSAVVKQGATPSNMLSGTMIPIPRGRWANLTLSVNFRAITLGSILGKLLDTMTLSKERLRAICNLAIKVVLPLPFILLWLWRR